VLIFVSVFVAICECVHLTQFLQFLWVLICFRFLELSVVFWTPLALKREPSLKKPGDFTVAKGHGHPLVLDMKVEKTRESFYIVGSLLQLTHKNLTIQKKFPSKSGKFQPYFSLRNPLYRLKS